MANTETIGLHIDVARMIAEQEKETLAQSTPEQIQLFKQTLVKRLSKMSQDELISTISLRAREATPEILAQFEQQERKAAELARAEGAATRQPGDDRLFVEGERALSPSLQAARLQLRETRGTRQAQEIGIETDVELPAGSFELGFGADQMKDLSNVLSDHYGQKVTAFRRGDDILYLDPDKQIVMKANPTASGLIGLAIPATGDIVGTIGVGGAVAASGFGSPAAQIAGETVGSGAGTALGEFIRLYTGKLMGVHDMSMSDILSRSGLEGMQAGVLTAGTGTIMATAKGVQNFRKGRNLIKADAMREGLTSQEADTLINEVNRILGKRGVKGTLFRRTDDVVIGAQEGRVRGNVKFAREFQERDIADLTALREALDKLGVTTGEKGGAAVQDILEARIGKGIEKSRVIAKRSADRLKASLDEMSITPKEDVGELTRNVITRKRELVEEAEAAAWKNIEDMGGFNRATETFGIQIPMGKETKRLRTVFADRAKKAKTVSGRKAATGVFAPEKAVPPAPVKEAPKGKITFHSQAAKGETPDIQDLAQFKEEISAIRKDIRALKKGENFNNPQIRDLQRVEKAMEADRAEFLVKSGRKDLLSAINEAEDATREFFRVYDKSMVGDLMAKNDKGVFKIQSDEFVNKVLKGSTEEADQLLEVIADQPSLMAKWQQGLANAYKRDVVDKVRPFKGAKLTKEMQDEIKQKTTDWLRQNKVAQKFFTDEQINQIVKAGDMLPVVKKQIAQVDDIINKANKKWGAGKLKSLDSDNLVKFVTNDSGSFTTPSGKGVQTALNKIRYVKNATKNHPGAWNKFRDDFLHQVRDDVIDPKTNLLDSDKLMKWTTEKGDVLEEIMGSRYADDFNVIARTAAMFTKTGRALTESPADAAAVQILRATVAPPLTRSGRALTAAQRLEDKFRHDVMARAFLNPDDLHKIARIAEHNRLTRVTAELAASLGLIGDVAEFTGQMMTPEKEETE